MFFSNRLLKPFLKPNKKKHRKTRKNAEKHVGSKVAVLFKYSLFLDSPSCNPGVDCSSRSVNALLVKSILRGRGRSVSRALTWTLLAGTLNGHPGALFKNTVNQHTAGALSDPALGGAEEEEEEDSQLLDLRVVHQRGGLQEEEETQSGGSVWANQSTADWK